MLGTHTAISSSPSNPRNRDPWHVAKLCGCGLPSVIAVGKCAVIRAMNWCFRSSEVVTCGGGFEL